MKKTFFEGVWKVLPIIAFVLIIDTIFYLIDLIESLIPQATIDSWGLPEALIKILGLLIFCVVVLVIGAISRHSILGHGFRVCLKPIYKVPLLGGLFRIFHRIEISFKNSNSFRESVFIQFPTDKVWTTGFLTGEAGEDDDDNGDSVAVFIPTSPNPTSGFTVYARQGDTVPTGVSRDKVLESILSGGVSSSEIRKALKEKASTAELDGKAIATTEKLLEEFLEERVEGILKKVLEEVLAKKNCSF